jgi:hypothetical protein
LYYLGRRGNLEKKDAVLLLSLVAILLVSLFGVRILLSNKRPEGEEYKALAKQLLEEAKGEFESIRGVSVRDVVLEVVDTDWVIEHWGKAYADPEKEDILRKEKIYKALFVISQDVSLYDTRIDWTASLHAAVWQGKIYVVEDTFDITNSFGAKSTFVHELTHILQGNYSMPPRPTTFDGDKARSSLTEGDATLMADTFRGEGVNPVVSSVTSGEDAFSSLIVPMFFGDIQASFPSTIDKLNRFPYNYGVDFVEALYDQGGWEAVEEAYSSPPNTTEQVMHPEIYFAQENAQTVGAPQMTGDWNLTKSDKLGEYFILVMLDNWIPTNDAEQAAAGWDGDNLTFYERDNEYLFTWKINWDTEDDAQDFYSSFEEMMDKTSAEKENGNYWFAYGRYISIQLNQKSTIIVSFENETTVQQPFLQ